MCAFGVHFIKEVSRSQLYAACKSMLPKEERKKLYGAEEQKFLKPLGIEFLKKKIVTFEKGSDLNNLSRNSVSKVGTF